MKRPQPAEATAAWRHAFSWQRLGAYTIRETIELLRDRIRLSFALFGTVFLMVVFGFGISHDVNNLTFAVMDHDQSHESRAYLEELRGSAYFTEQPPLANYEDLEKRLKSGEIKAGIEIPPGFGRDLVRGRPVWIGAWVDGSMPYRAETIRGYLEAMHQLYLSDPAVKTTRVQAAAPASIEIRFKYNQNFESVYAMVPISISLMLALIPAILMAVAIAQAQSNSQELHNASIAYVDEDHSELSRRIVRAFLPPYFQTPQPITERDIIPLMNAGRYNFIIDIPPNFEKYVLRGRRPAIQVNVDATAMVQAGLGSGYAEQIITTEIRDFLSRKEGAPLPPVNIDVRVMFNPNIDTAWFTSVMGVINNITMLGIILAGAAIVREREYGTMDHLLVMPVTPFEIAMSKVWANALVITVATALSLYLVVHMLLEVPIVGSVPLFLIGVSIYLFFACAIGIFLGTVARTMPQLGLLFMLVFLPMNLLSGSNTPLESMPHWLATVMQASPSTHFVSFAQSILYRGAGIDVVWRQFVFVGAVGAVFLAIAILRFRSTSAQAV